MFNFNTSRFMRLFSSTCVLFIFAFNAHAVNALAPDVPKASLTNIQFESIQGLSSDIGDVAGTVNAIIRDSHGFMWFGGTLGLVRYDGRELYKLPLNAGEGSLRSSFINTLALDNKGNLWVGTANGLHLYNYATESFKWIGDQEALGYVGKLDNEDIIYIQAKENLLYIGTQSGISILNTDTNTIENIRGAAEGSPLLKDTVAAFAFQENGIIWVGYGFSGITRYDPINQSSTHYNEDTGLCGNEVARMAIDHHNRLWIATLGGWICRFDPSTNEFITYTEMRSVNSTKIMSDMITNVQVFEDELWITLDHGGIGYYDQSLDTFVIYSTDSHNPKALPEISARTLYIDPDGDLWASLYPRGVVHSNRMQRNISVYRKSEHNTLPLSLTHSGVLSVEFINGRLWVGTENGLNISDSSLGDDLEFRSEVHNETVLAILDDGEKVWVGTWASGIFIFTRDGKLIGRPLDGKFNGYRIWSLLKTEDNRILIGTGSRGLYTYDPDKSTIENLSAESNMESSLTNNSVFALHEDRRRNIWVGTFEGVDIVNPRTKLVTSLGQETEFENYSGGERIVSIFEDTSNNIWIGTQDKGVTRFSNTDKTYLTLTIQNGLPSNYVASIAEDNNGFIWLGTSDGLVKISKDGGVIRILKQEDGLAGEGYTRDAVKTAGNKLIAGSETGLSIFDPTVYGADPVPVSPTFTTLSLERNARQLKGGEGLKKSIYMTDKIEIPNDIRNFSIHFSTLDYRANNSKYHYFIDGITNGWVQTDVTNSISFTAPKSGKYQIRVRATGHTNNHSGENILQLKIHASSYELLLSLLPYIVLGLIVILIFITYWGVNQRKGLKSITPNGKHMDCRSLNSMSFTLEAALSSCQDYLQTFPPNTAKDIDKWNTFEIIVNHLIESSKKVFGVSNERAINKSIQLKSICHTLNEFLFDYFSRENKNVIIDISESVTLVTTQYNAYSIAIELFSLISRMNFGSEIYFKAAALDSYTLIQLAHTNNDVTQHEGTSIEIPNDELTETVKYLDRAGGSIKGKQINGLTTISIKIPT